MRYENIVKSVFSIFMNIRPVYFVRFFLWFLLIFLGVYLGLSTFRDTRDQLSGIESSSIGGSFEAMSTHHGSINRLSMLGRPHLLLFGYTHCPDFCPTTLTSVSMWLSELGSSSDNLDVYFVTIDPSRDSIDHLRDYLSHFDSRIIGISGTQSQIDTITSAWRVYAQSDGDGLFSHSVTTFLMDSSGNFVSTISYGENSTTALSKLRNLLSSG